MLKRYRYRAYPTGDQQQMLARSFGCSRVVFNDAIAARQTARAAGVKISDTDVQKQVVTEAKRTLERAWLGEVSSVVLVQACQDARRAYRNFFDSLAGKRKGRRIGAPRFRSRRDNRQSIRFTRNGFTVTRRGVRLAKIGDVKLEWSRELPSEPSSVSVIREADGRYYVSFVVDVAETPLPEAPTVVGVDLGLADLAAIARSDGVREKIAAPRHLRKVERRLARAQKALSRKQKGSSNRAKDRLRVARLHRRVRETRLDHHHKLAKRLIHENQVVAVEDLAVSGLARTWLAKSVHDAGWSILLRVLEEKAAQHGRQVIRIDRWTPSTRTCSHCGRIGEAKPLHIRQWTCDCGAHLDRDYNAAVNILDAAGLAESLNARGGDVRLALASAGPAETGTHRTDPDHPVEAA
ncbi:RNA-guided endonuclease InsQ/TnpB family protein [Rhodococcus sp. ACT016]|uniref:RNA-guided endonuclease InsQ/TnpB family protein n=1 Tax=Rhodococcus sp. ACT016 TaxID=3134808 RepID=UPI003D2E9129